MKKCQKCSAENDNLMSFCWECGTPLPESFAAEAKTEEFSVSPANNSQTFYQKAATEQPTLRVDSNFAGNIQPAQPSGKNKNGLLLLLGGIIFLVGFGVLAGAATVIYTLLTVPKPQPTSSPYVIARTPTPNASPTTTPQVSFTPPLEPTKQGSFTVYANQGWQLSNIDIVPLEEFRTTVQGKIDISGLKKGVSAAGVADVKTISRRIYPEFSTGALLMRTRFADGKTSNIVAILGNGANGNWRNYPDELGKIEFCINDNSPAENSGQFTVTATLTRVPKAKK